MKNLLFLFATLSLVCTNIQAQQLQTLRVSTIDSYTEAPLVGANVELIQDGGVLDTATTGPDGSATFSVTVVSVEDLPSYGFNLGSAYPNPSSGSTSIPLIIEHSGDVDVGLYDLLGRRVASNSATLVAGTHEIDISLGDLAAGIYIVRVITANNAASQRIVRSGTGGQTRSISFRASNRIEPVTGAAKWSSGPNDYQLRVTHDGYVNGSFTIEMPKDQEFTAWMNVNPEAVAYNGFVVAETGDSQVPLVAAFEDGTTFHVLSVEGELPTGVIVTGNSGEQVTLIFRDDGFPKYAYANGMFALFENYRDGLVDAAFIDPNGETIIVRDINIDDAVSAGKFSVSSVALDLRLSKIFASIGVGSSIVSCGASFAATLGTGSVATPFLFLTCGSLAAKTLAFFIPTDNPFLAATAAGVGAFADALGCINPINPVSWSSCISSIASIGYIASLAAEGAFSDNSSSIDSALQDLRSSGAGETTTNSIGMELVRIPSGTFQMGSNNGWPREQPVHGVTLTRDFWIGKYEVTQGEYRAVTGQSPSRNTGDDRLPVEQVSWFDAIGFANTLSQAEGFTLCYDGSGHVIGGDIYTCTGYRLPTEAEWEYMARAGTTTEYSFGSDAEQLGTYAWYLSNSGELMPEPYRVYTYPVGGKQPNPWGLYDVHGNVWEWSHDWYDSTYYGTSRSSNPPGPIAGSNRVARGGNWWNPASSLRSAMRADGPPTDISSGLGFRLARTTS